MRGIDGGNCRHALPQIQLSHSLTHPIKASVRPNASNTNIIEDSYFMNRTLTLIYAQSL
jgi:hypothetical protein